MCKTMSETVELTSVTISFGGKSYTLPLLEAVSIRDSLCARLGCPSFCDKEGQVDKVDAESMAATIKIVNTEEV